MRYPPLPEHALRRLLVWLDGGVDSHGEIYLEMRQRLVAYFDRRDSLSAEALADETFSRIARTLEQPGGIAVAPPARYCYAVARLVLREDIRRRKSARVSAAITIAGLALTSTGEVDTVAMRERRVACCDRCLNALDRTQRDLIVEYYRCAGREKIDARRALAARLGITMNALSHRAFRIRALLERCMANCVDRSSPDRDRDA